MSSNRKFTDEQLEMVGRLATHAGEALDLLRGRWWSCRARHAKDCLLAVLQSTWVSGEARLVELVYALRFAVDYLLSTRRVHFMFQAQLIMDDIKSKEIIGLLKQASERDPELANFLGRCKCSRMLSLAEAAWLNQ